MLIKNVPRHRKLARSIRTLDYFPWVLRYLVEVQFVERQFIVKQLDSLSTSKQLEQNVSNECISNVGASSYAVQLHQTK
jgi:hypothetical protein